MHPKRDKSVVFFNVDHLILIFLVSPDETIIQSLKLNVTSRLYCIPKGVTSSLLVYSKEKLNASRFSEHPSVRGRKCQNV